MYSVVLMAALSAGASVPDCWFKHGCGGCYGGGCYGGGCYGGGCYGGYGGGCYGCYGAWGCYASYGCHGCYGCYGCYGCTGVAPMYYAPPAVGAEPIAKPKPEDKDKKGPDETSRSNKARLIVELPADAKLYIDNQAMKTPSERRVFNTPTLEPGQAYYYILRAEIVRDGKTFTDTKQVVVRAGADIQANFNDLELAAAGTKPLTAARR